VTVYADPDGRGLVTLGRGLAGRWELSVEVAPRHRGAGVGRRLIAAGRRVAPAGEPLFAQVAPSNAASLRAFLAAGFRPIGAEVLFLRDAAR
jgi:L-amino acid N-acyltransferase YncA